MEKIPVTTIYLHNRPVDILRLERAQPEIQGNKFYKLKYNLKALREQGCDTLVTFGGVFSNHIHAAAIACRNENIRGVAILRGEDDPSNPTLKHIRSLGMETVFVNRGLYRHKHEIDIAKLIDIIPDKTYILPEGGTNTHAVKGCAEILQGLENSYDHIFCAVGTGGTLAGLISTPGLIAEVTGVSVLKAAADMIAPFVKSLTASNPSSVKWNINFDYHLGGYAAYHQGLVDFISDFDNQHHILLDPVYTGKLLYAVNDIITQKKIDDTKRILVIHSGGLQGWMGWNYRFSNQHMVTKS